jgi:hypothetical protein
MVDIGTIASAIGSLKAAGDIAKAMSGLHDAQVIQAKVIELQGVILAAQTNALAAQSDQLTLLEEIRTLKAKMAELEAWNAQKKRYQLQDFGGGTFAYALKPEEAQGEPMHRICPACYEKGHRSVLQFQFRNAAHQDKYNCPSCKTEFTFGHRAAPSVNRGRSDWSPFG